MSFITSAHSSQQCVQSPVNTDESVKCMTAILNCIAEAWLAAYFICVTRLRRKYQHYFSTKCFMSSTAVKRT